MDFSTTMRRLRRSIASFSVLAIVASLSIVSAVSAFSDVPESAPYASYVSELLDLGIISNNATFRPADKLSRAEAAKIAVKAAGVEDADLSTKTGTFSDVSAKLWDGMALKYIETAAELKIVNGDAGKKTFRPNDDVTRAELAAIIVRAYELAEDTAGGPHFSDVTSAFWGYNVVETAYNWSVVNGYGDNSFKPNAKVIRQDMAAMVSRANAGEKRTTTVPPVTGAVSVALASDTPAQGSVVIATAAGADIARFVLTGTGTVTGVALQRIGISADASLSNVYLFDGAVRLTDSASVTAGGMVNFNNAGGLFTVNGSRTITVKSDLAATSGELLGVKLTAVTLASGTVGGLPVSGNTLSVAAATLAGASFGTVTPVVATPQVNTTINPGTDQLLWQSSLSVTTRDVVLKSIAFREIGSINYVDVKNFRLYVDGVLVSTVANLDANGYVTFVPASPVTVKTGAARVFKVIADVIGGSSRTLSLSLRTKADAALLDSQYNAGVALSSTLPATANTLAVASGSVTVQKTSDSPAGNVTLAGSDVTIAKYTFTAFGEPVKVETLLVDFAYGDTLSSSGNVNSVATLRNGRVLVNGAQVGSTTTLTTVSTGTSFNTNFIVTPGTPATVEVRADMFDNDGNLANSGTDVGLQTNDTITVTLSTGASNGQGQVSQATSNVPTGNVGANLVTVKQGSMSIAKTTSYGNQNTVVPLTAYKLASFQLNGNSTEDVNVNTVSVDFTSVTNATFAAADLTNVYLVWGGVQEPSTKATVAATANAWSVSHLLPKNGNVQVDIFADVGSAITDSDSIKSTIIVTGTTAVSGNTTGTDSAGDGTGTGTDGQTIIYKGGTVGLALDASAPKAKLIDDSQTVTTSVFKVSPVNEGITITDISAALAGTSTVQNVILKAGTSLSAMTSVATKSAASTTAFTGLNIVVAAGTTQYIAFDLQLGSVATGAGTSAENVRTNLSAFGYTKSTGAVGTIATTTAGGAVTANNIYVYKAIPTIALGNLPNTKLAAGTMTIAKFTVGATGGTVAWDKMMFSLAKTSDGSNAPTIGAATSAYSLYDDANNPISGYFSGTTMAAATGTGSLTFVPATEEQVSGSKTYVLKATIGVTGNLATGMYISTSLAQPSSTPVSSAVTAQAYNVLTAYYTDVDNSATVTAGDIRAASTTSYTAPQTTSAAFSAGAGNGLVTKAFGITSGQTIVVASDGSGNLTAITGTATTGATCTAYNSSDAVVAVGAAVTGVRYVECITGTTKSVRVTATSDGTTAESLAGSSKNITYTLTTGTAYAAGSVVAAGNSDLNTALTAGVAGTASFVWSDVSADSHTTATTDWANDYKVVALPTDSQTVTF